MLLERIAANPAVSSITPGRIRVTRAATTSLELRFGELAVMVADEFPEMDVLGPLSIGGTPVVLHLLTDDVDEAVAVSTDADGVRDEDLAVVRDLAGTGVPVLVADAQGSAQRVVQS